jgi:hypothetical protein
VKTDRHVFERTFLTSFSGHGLLAFTGFMINIVIIYIR